ncbi:hypothetical protein FBUS_07997 [Fasciolopsis buskii]|uniref:Uncharacterized protein n=1 Tax=Fasciolopsis buskii TaxID=27845 RepID=A0A8E0RJ86_9TREM|nr:hypothetical protein FBUS_07997 [Fasciolopsis buski]
MPRAFIIRLLTGTIASYQKWVARLERKWENRHPRSFRNYSLFKKGKLASTITAIWSVSSIHCPYCSFRSAFLFQSYVGIHSTLVDLNDLRLVWSRIALNNRPILQTLHTMTRRELFVFRQAGLDNYYAK